MPKTFREQPQIITAIAAETGLGFRTTGRLIDACLAAAYELVYNDYAIYAPPLAHWNDGDPVIAALRAKRRACSERQFEGWTRKDDQQLAEWLDLDPAVVARYPVAKEYDILALAVEWLGWDLDDLEQWPASARRDFDRLERVLYAWLETFAGDRTYYPAGPGPAGREKAFEDWFETRLAVLAELGYPVDPRPGHYYRQYYLTNRKIADLVCRFIAPAALPAGDAAAGDWLVIENKTTGAYAGAAGQLEAYCTQLQSQLADPGQKVFGLLIADGATPKLREHLAERRLGYLTLTALGYRRRNWRPLRKPHRGV